MNRKELSEIIAAAAAKTEAAASVTEAAAARTEAAAAQAEEARARQEAATARWEATQVDAAERNKKLDTMLEEMKAQTAEMKANRTRAEAAYEDEKIWREEYLRRQEKMFHDYLHRADQTLAETKQQTVEIIAELKDQRDERQALKEAVLMLIDRLPPPPPHLRSA